MLVNEYFSAYTTEKMAADDVYLPLCDSAKADLLKLLEDNDDHMWLSLVDESRMETVRAINDHGTLILERGMEGTAAVAHPLGTCVRAVSPTIVALVKDLVCNYSCCEGGCPCTPASYAGSVIPEAIVGVKWEGSVVFSGDQPMQLAVNGGPAWLSVKAVGSVIMLSGVPNRSGEYYFSAAASNCGGTVVASEVLRLVVRE